MGPICLILAALAAGTAKGVGDAAARAVKEACAGLGIVTLTVPVHDH